MIRRHTDYHNQPEVIANLNKVLNKYYLIATNNVSLYNVKADEHSHISESDKQEVVQRCSDIQNFVY